MLERFFARSAHSCCMGSHRRLPHIYPKARCLFLPWHLYGSLPQGQYPPPHHLSAGRAFVWMDRYLDRAEWGPGFFSTSPSLRSSLTLCGVGAGWGLFHIPAFLSLGNTITASFFLRAPPPPPS